MRALLTLVMVLCWCNLSAQVFFTPNKGQWNKAVKAKVNLANGAMFLEEKALTFNFIDATYFSHSHDYDAMSIAFKLMLSNGTLLEPILPKSALKKKEKGCLIFSMLSP